LESGQKGSTFVGMKSMAAAGAAAVLLALALGTPVGAGPNPETCEGYPEPRVFLENQSWWEAQPGPASHPGTGKQGHIHIGTCFPLYQTVTGTGDLRFDVKIQLHNMPGTAVNLRLAAYGDAQHETTVPNKGKWTCPQADCTVWTTATFPLSKPDFSGWREFHVFLIVNNADGKKQYNITRYYLTLANGKPAGTLDKTGTFTNYWASSPGGDSWFNSDFPTTKYAKAVIGRNDFPYTADLKPKPVSGIWTPEVRFTVPEGFAYIDAALHASPPNKGTVVYEQLHVTSPTTTRLRIDTTRLTNGTHRLLLGSCNPIPVEGKHCGTLVVPFLVANP
jgi:hypothetical protein